MRLDPTEIPCLPLPAALLDRRGTVVSATQEWQGAMPGSVCYHAGEARLLVAPDGTAWPAQEAVMRRLLDEMRAAVAAMTGDQALYAAVLGSGLELVAGWPPDDAARDSIGSVLARARTVIEARVPEADVEMVGGTAQPVPAMATDIEECAHVSGAVTYHQNRILSHVCGHEIAWMRNLAVMTQEQPAACKDLPQLCFVDLRLDEDTAADQPVLSIDECGNLCCHDASNGLGR